MDIFLISDSQVSLATALSPTAPPNGFLWLDVTHDEVVANPDAWRDAVERTTGTRLYDLHLLDVANLSHPSYFDSTQDYEMVVFRKLALAHNTAAPSSETVQDSEQRRKVPPALNKLATIPVTFLLMNRALVTIHARNSLLDYKCKPDGATHGSRPSTSPEELMLRLLNAMVD